MMNIVVLDGYTLNPGDLSWDALKALGNVEIYDRTDPDDITDRSKNSEIILTNKTPLAAGTIKNLPSLKYIGVLATGFDLVDIETAQAQGITVTNVPAYSTMAVAQHVFALILEFFNGAGSLSDGVKEGRWNCCIDYCYWDKPLAEIAGKTIGIVGFGRIGRAVARIAEAFEMRVIVNEITEVKDRENESLDSLLGQSDIVTLHCPLTRETRGIINGARLRMMKPAALLVNCARGQLIVEQDLADALNEGVIAAAALDVLSVEPPQPANPLLTAKNCIITPHVAWAAFEARKRLMETAVNNVRCFLEGKPLNVVS